MLYGMTAGHILAQQSLGQYNFDQVDFCDEQDEDDEQDEGFYSDEEEYELDDDAFEGEEEVQDMATMGDRTRNVSQSMQLGHLWPKIGCVSAASNEGTITGHDFDWALIDFDRPADYRPNLLVLLDGENGAARNRPLKENGKFTEDGSSRSVFLLSGTGGVKKGTLSTSLSFLMMGPAKAFAKTYTLVLPQGSGKYPSGICSQTQLRFQVLKAGDCGSWVVDPSTCEVYGHVVASDAMGDTYVVPLDATLRDMEKKLGATVSLPTEAHIRKWLAQHVKAAAKDVTVPTRSKKKQVAFNDSIIDRVKSPRDLQKLAGHSSQAVVESLDSQNTTDISDGRSKRSAVTYLQDVQQKTTVDTSRQQTSAVPQSIRSMFSSFRKEPSRNSPQKDGDKGKSIGSSKDSKTAGSGSSMKPAATPSTTLTTKTSKNNTEKSKSMKTSASPTNSTGLSTPSSAPAGRVSGDFPLAPPAPRAILDRRVSLPSATPTSPRTRQSERILPHSPRPPPQHSNPKQISYEGYTFTKLVSNQAGLKETWAVAKMVPMPVSQDDLKDEIKRNRKKHISALDEYNDKKMNGFKRKQVDNLIRERTKIDGDYGYEYVLASIKLDLIRQHKSNLSETVSMQVILKRQMTADFLHDPSTGSSMDVHAKLPSQVIDLTSGDEAGMARYYGGGSQVVGHQGSGVSFASHTEYGAFPLLPAHGQFSGHGVQRVDDKLLSLRPTPLPFESPDSPAQDRRQPHRPHSAPLAHEKINDTQGHFRGVNINIESQKNNSKEKAPKMIYTNDSVSNSPTLSDLSSEFESDHSWAKTDATPDTVFSGESREYRKEKTPHKESKESSHNKDIIGRTPYASGIEQPVWRERKRDEHRHSSLSPARKSRDVSPNYLDLDLALRGQRAPLPRYSYGTRYRAHGQYETEPAVSFPTNRAPRYRRRSVSPERPSHRRALSYELDRSLAPNPRDLVPMHRRPDLYSHEAELAREQEEWERPRLQREEHEERTRRTVMMETERYEKERLDAERDVRMEKMRDGERRGRVIIERRDSRRGTTYDDRYMPRYRRDPDYYYD